MASLALRLVRDHPKNLRSIRLAHQTFHIQVALFLRGLRSQDVALESLAALHFASPRLLKPLGGAGVCLKFRHKNSPPLPAGSPPFGHPSYFT